ncbi:HAD family hydrolase [Planctomycetota bacterium]
MIDTIIFDADGVVVDTENLWDKAQEKFLRRRGLVYTREKMKPLLTGTSLEVGTRIMKQEYGLQGDAETLSRERAEIMMDLLEYNVEFIDGFWGYFEKIRSRYKTCIATSMAEDLLRIIDRQLDLFELFDGKIFSLADVGYHSKPNPDLFLYAVRQLESKVENCVVIEDSPHGVEAAKRAGIICIALTTTYDREKLTTADIVVDSYSEIDITVL